ncbi:MAG: copper-translocating P-type ATPase [Nanoarchaeota archaeon]|nr:copper-translocating P-type ATPase [Nanoarchaeota archaeon]
MIYSCPMHPDVVREKPGMCPECGMQLLASRKRAESASWRNAETRGNDKHAGHKTESFLKKFWISLALTIPVLLYSELPQKFFGWTAPVFTGSEYLPFVLGSAVFWYGGLVFLKSAWREIRGKLPGMMTLIAMAITAAYVWSVYQTFRGEHTLFWELTTLITIMLLGHWIEMKAVQSAKGALKELSKLLPDTAELMFGKSDPAKAGSDIQTLETKIVPLSELKEGDIVIIRPGAKVPVDGVVIEGKTEINESIVTGESKPVDKEKGVKVIAGTTNGDGTIFVEVTEIGEHTFLAGIMRLVEEAERSKSRLQTLSDKAALYLTGVAILVGGGALGGWLILGAAPAFAIERFVAVLVIACPHALGLAIPLVASISTTLAARSGLLVKNRLALEEARRMDVVVFDKTGTLTKGEFGITKITANKELNITNDDVLKLAASVDVYSEHPIAKAIAAHAKEKGIEFFPANNFRRIPGRGGEAEVNGETIFVGREENPSTDESDPPAGGIETKVVVTKNEMLLGALFLRDVIREESKEAIQELQKQGIEVAMITGDSDSVAKAVAEELGIKIVFSRVLPHEKSEKVKLLKNQGKRVVFVGDGVNDAPALAEANVGIAIGAGTNIAIESAGIILVRNNPKDIATIFRLSKATYRKMIQNLFWASGYNIIAMPLAAGVLAGQGIMLEPAASAILMSFSTVIVAVNALMLKRFKFS